MAAEWTVLGAGSILPRAGYGCAGHALRSTPGGRVTLFDCGPGTIRALASAGIGLGEVERVAISHFHPDHWLDLLALAFARRNPASQPAPRLELVGPRGEEIDKKEVASQIIAAKDKLAIKGPTGQPLRGLGAGEFVLPADLVEGWYTLTVAEIGRASCRERVYVLV